MFWPTFNHVLPNFWPTFSQVLANFLQSFGQLLFNFWYTFGNRNSIEMCFVLFPFVYEGGLRVLESFVNQAIPLVNLWPCFAQLLPNFWQSFGQLLVNFLYTFGNRNSIKMCFVPFHFLYEGGLRVVRSFVNQAIPLANFWPCFAQLLCNFWQSFGQLLVNFLYTF